MNYVSLKKNSCNKNGGSLYIENSQNLSFVNITVENNVALNFGGGVYV